MSRRPTSRGYGSNEISNKGALVQLKIMLSNARNLDQFTPENLHARYKVRLKQCEYELIIARQQRKAIEG